MPLGFSRASIYRVLVTSERIEVVLDADLLARLDAACARLHLTRDELLSHFISKGLDAERLSDLFAREDAVLHEAGERFGDDKDAALAWIGKRRKELGLDQAW